MTDQPHQKEPDALQSRREARDLLQCAGLPTDGLEPGDGVANEVWLTPGHVVRLNDGRFRGAFRYEARVLGMLPTEIPHPVVVAHGPGMAASS